MRVDESSSKLMKPALTLTVNSPRSLFSKTQRTRSKALLLASPRVVTSLPPGPREFLSACVSRVSSKNPLLSLLSSGSYTACAVTASQRGTGKKRRISRKSAVQVFIRGRSPSGKAWSPLARGTGNRSLRPGKFSLSVSRTEGEILPPRCSLLPREEPSCPV